MKVDVLDRVPQLPPSWANHVFYGFVGGVALMCMLAAFGVHRGDMWSFAAVLAVSAAKKLWDRFNEGESWAVCVGKTVVTATVPFAVWVTAYLPN